MPDSVVARSAPPGGPVPTETIHVDDRVVACDGGDGALGHPRVWLRIGCLSFGGPAARFLGKQAPASRNCANP